MCVIFVSKYGWYCKTLSTVNIQKISDVQYEIFYILPIMITILTIIYCNKIDKTI